MDTSENKNQEQEWIDTLNTEERQILDLRTIGMNHALALGRFRYRHAATPLEEQSHHQWLILQFVLSGQQQLIVDEREILIKGGEMNRYRIHDWCRRGTELPVSRAKASGIISPSAG